MKNSGFKLARMVDFVDPGSRLVVAAIALFCALYLALQPSALAAVFLLVFSYLIWDYFRNNGVWGAFREFRQGHIEQMRRLVRQVKWPALLSSRSLAYYHWLRGVVEMADGRFGAARVHLLIAAAGALKTANDRSLVQCLLVEVSLQSEEPGAAAEHLRLAQALDHHPEVDRIIGALQRRLG